MPTHGVLDQLIYRHRLLGKRVLAAAGRILPPALSRRLRSAAERLAFRIVPQYQGDTLPPIFHFWSNRFVRPMVERLGFETPEAMYLLAIRRHWRKTGRPLSLLSLGSGGCALELQLARQLVSDGIPFHLECMDLNPTLMARARQDAVQAGVADHMGFSVGDCNHWLPDAPRDVVIVNQFFHHIEDIDAVCARLGGILAADGRLLTCDVIGRNGHVLWPDVDARVQAHWRRLPPGKRIDRHDGKVSSRYRSVDHAAYSNEGVRAQDIVPSLLEHFEFETFLTFGGVIVPFVERRIGFNFDPDSMEDTDFILRVAEEDQRLIGEGAYPASNMIATLGHRGRVEARHYDPVSPERHAALTRRQQAIAG